MFASRGLNKILFLSIAIYCATKDLSSAKSVCKMERNITLKKIHGNYSLNWDGYPIAAERYCVEIYEYKKITASKRIWTKKNNTDLSIGELEEGKYEIHVLPYVKGDIWFHQCFGQNFTIRSTKPRWGDFMLEPDGKCCGMRNESIYGIRDLKLVGSDNSPNDNATYNLTATFKGPLSPLLDHSIERYSYTLYKYENDGINHGDRIENKNDPISLKDVKQTNLEFRLDQLEKNAKYFIKVGLSYDIGSERRFYAMQTFKYQQNSPSKIDIHIDTLAPRIINTVGKLRMEAEYKGQYDIMVNWSIDHIKNRVFFENIEYFQVELWPTNPKMTAHRQSHQLEKSNTGFTFPNVTSQLEYRITVALSFKDEHKNMSLKDHVTARVFIYLPRILD
ncbi:unnamed protein product [Gordionus sp. m RMFG-2023]